jgi:protein NrfC
MKENNVSLKIDRRTVLAGAGTLTLAALGGCSADRGKTDSAAPNYVLIFDQNKCIGCGLCKRSCSETNHVPAGQVRMTLERQSPLGCKPEDRKYVRVSCQQCKDAPCVRVCPTGAAYRDPKTGIVTMDASKCVGCKYCIAACPYNVRFINKETKVAENCDFCLKTKLANGEEPACVQACRHGALAFGDLNEPNSYVGKLLAVKDSVRIRPHLGTEPRVRYIPIVKQGV